MAWETRNGRSYYYRKQRIGAHVVSEYVGSGLLGDIAAGIDELDRAQRQAQLEAHRRECAQVEAIDQELDQVGTLTRDLTRVALLLAGYHPHKRQWRRRGNDRV